MSAKILVAAAVTLLALASTVGDETAAFHPFHEPVVHLSDYHDPVPNASWGVSFCCTADPTAQVNGFLEHGSGWQLLNAYQPTDFYPLAYQSSDIQMSWVTDAGMQQQCGGLADACTAFANTTCVSTCAQDLRHDTQVQMWVRAATWTGYNTNTRRTIINHEVGHTLGLAEHYVNDPVRGSINDTTPYGGVMDNDVDVDGGGYPNAPNEILGAHWSTSQWY